MLKSEAIIFLLYFFVTQIISINKINGFYVVSDKMHVAIVGITLLTFPVTWSNSVLPLRSGSHITVEMADCNPVELLLSKFDRLSFV